MWKSSCKCAAWALVVGTSTACGSDAPLGTIDAGQNAAPDARFSDPLSDGSASTHEAGPATPEGSVSAPNPASLDGSALDDAGGCDPVSASHPDEGAQHLDPCSPTSYLTNPPSSGNHYGIWAAYKTYAQPFLRGFWVHNLEHGAVVITYNCPQGCAAEVAAAQELIDALPADPGCSPPVKNRIIMLPDPELDVRFAASSWGFTLRAGCFDREAFTAFIDAHYGRGLEAVCANGADPLTDALGGGPICAR